MLYLKKSCCSFPHQNKSISLVEISVSHDHSLFVLGTCVNIHEIQAFPVRYWFYASSLRSINPRIFSCFESPVGEHPKVYLHVGPRASYCKRESGSTAWSQPSGSQLEEGITQISHQIRSNLRDVSRAWNVATLAQAVTEDGPLSKDTSVLSTHPWKVGPTGCPPQEQLYPQLQLALKGDSPQWIKAEENGG